MFVRGPHGDIMLRPGFEMRASTGLPGTRPPMGAGRSPPGAFMHMYPRHPQGYPQQHPAGHPGAVQAQRMTRHPMDPQAQQVCYFFAETIPPFL